MDFVINRFFNEIIQNNKHGSYSVMPELFLFWIAECHVEKRSEKFRNKYSEYYLQLLRYINEPYIVFNIFFLFFLLLVSILYF